MSRQKRFWFFLEVGLHSSNMHKYAWSACRCPSGSTHLGRVVQGLVRYGARQIVLLAQSSSSVLPQPMWILNDFVTVFFRWQFAQPSLSADTDPCRQQRQLPLGYSCSQTSVTHSFALIGRPQCPEDCHQDSHSNVPTGVPIPCKVDSQ